MFLIGAEERQKKRPANQPASQSVSETVRQTVGFLTIPVAGEEREAEWSGCLLLLLLLCLYCMVRYMTYKAGFGFAHPRDLAYCNYVL